MGPLAPELGSGLASGTEKPCRVDLCGSQDPVRLFWQHNACKTANGSLLI